jgi:hypothetical protein
MPTFEKLLENDLSWREAELSSLKVLALEEANKAVRVSTLLRALLALLYAHYEGFTKFAWDAHLFELSRRNLLRKELISPLAILSAEEEIKRLRSASYIDFWSFLTGMSQYLEQKVEFPKQLEKRANLWPEVFEENLDRLGLKCNTLNVYRAELRSLVAKRNEVAHGRKLLVKDLNEYLLYEHRTLVLMHDLAITLCDCLDSATFKVNA